jgi:hypothetical protein
MRGRGDADKRGRGDTEKRQLETRGHGEAGTRRRGEAETRRRGEAGTRRRGDADKRGRGEAETRDNVAQSERTITKELKRATFKTTRNLVCLLRVNSWIVALVAPCLHISRLLSSHPASPHLHIPRRRSPGVSLSPRLGNLRVAASPSAHLLSASPLLRVPASPLLPVPASPRPRVSIACWTKRCKHR